MKLWLQSVFAAILFCSWSVPMDPAGDLGRRPASTLSSLKQAGKDLGQQLKVVMSSSAQSPFMISLVDGAGKVVSKIATSPTPKNVLNQFKPSEMSKYFKKMQETSKSVGKFTGQIMFQKLKHFPAEAFGFFVALGALVYFDMYFKAAFNPVGFTQLIDQQYDPVGQFAFYSFMVGAGLSSQPFLNMIQGNKLNPKWAPLITYSGMGIGFLASTIVSEIGHWPGLAGCVTGLKSSYPDSMKACDAAASAWYEKGGWKGTGQQVAAGIAGLVGSTILSSLIQTGLVKGVLYLSALSRGVYGLSLTAGEKILEKVLPVTGLNLDLMLDATARPVIKAVSVALPDSWRAYLKKTLQNTLFIGVQMNIDHWIAYRVQTVLQSSDIEDLDENLTQSLLNAKNRSWDPSSTQRLKNDVEEMMLGLKRWRSLNLTEVNEAHANWQQKLTQLSLMYQSSELFYKNFIGNLWERKNGDMKEAYASGRSTSILDRIMPLNGVVPQEAEVKDEATWLKAPGVIQKRQQARIQTVVSQFTVPSSLPAEDIATLQNLAKQLMDENPIAVGKALDQINCLLRIDPAPTCTGKALTPDMKDILMYLRQALGNPRPLWQPGAGYLAAFELTPAMSQVTQLTPFKQNWPNRIYTPSFTESMIASMIFGPDIQRGESAVENENGYVAIWRAPRIVDETKFKFQRDKAGTVPLAPTPNDARPNVFSAGLYDVLNKAIIPQYIWDMSKPSDGTPNIETFDNWWANHAERQYRNAWVDFERKYQYNIGRLIHALDAPESMFNWGPATNSLMGSYFQQARLAMMILGEVEKDYFLMNLKAIPPEIISKNSSLINVEKKLEAQKKEKKSQPELIAFLKNNTSLDFSAYMKLQKQPVNANLDRSERHNLIWQDVFEAKLKELHGLLKKLKVQDIQVGQDSLQGMPVSTLDQNEFHAKAEELRQILKRTRQYDFGKNLVTSPALEAIVNSCFEALTSVVQELESLAAAANAVSYVQHHGEKGFIKGQCAERSSGTSLKGFKATTAKIEGC